MYIHRPHIYIFVRIFEYVHNWFVFQCAVASFIFVFESLGQLLGFRGD